MKLIRLGGKNKDKHAIVDDEYYDILKKYCWHLNTCGYAQSNHKCPENVSSTNPKGKGMIKMHQVVMLLSHEIPDLCYCDSSYSQRIVGISPIHIDHINNDKLDNRLSNLRYESASYNISKRGSRAGQHSKYNGVYFHKHHGKWHARYKINGKTKHIGYFENTPAGEIEAAEAHDVKCRSLGLDRMLNFP